MSGSFYSNIHELGIVIIYASSLHILMAILIDMNVNCVLLLWKNKQKRQYEQCRKKLPDKNDDQLLLNDFIRAIINFLYINWIS